MHSWKEVEKKTRETTDEKTDEMMAVRLVQPKAQARAALLLLPQPSAASL